MKHPLTDFFTLSMALTSQTMNENIVYKKKAESRISDLDYMMDFYKSMKRSDEELITEEEMVQNAIFLYEQVLLENKDRFEQELNQSLKIMDKNIKKKKNKAKLKPLYIFDQVSDLDLFSWYHNTTLESGYSELKGKKRIIPAEIPLNPKLHKLVNTYKGNEDNFVEKALDILEQFSVPALYSIARITKLKPRPVIIGISEITNDSVERDFRIGRNFLKMVSAIEPYIDEKTIVSPLIGNTHIEPLLLFVQECSNLQVKNVYEIGVPRDLNIDIPNNLDTILNNFRPINIMEKLMQGHLLLSQT